MNRDIEFDVAEVLQYDYTYQYVPAGQPDSTVNNLFAIKVRTCSRLLNREPILARPAEMYAKRIPLVGEIVLIYKTLNQEATSRKQRYNWYYVSTIDLQSGVNENRLPGLSLENVNQEYIDQSKPGYTFNKKTISPLQPYEGDYIFEGRWGNSLRFGSTVDYSAGLYNKRASWDGVSSGDPIIVLSNGRNNKPKKEFVVEDIKTDASALYLTSTQKLTNLILGDSNNANSLSCFMPNESAFNRSQLVGIADRIVLKAKTDVAIIDASKGIVLNTRGEIKLGSDDANESMVHGDELLGILQKILNQLNTPIMCGGLVGTFMDKSAGADAQSKLRNLLSKKYFIKK